MDTTNTTNTTNVTGFLTGLRQGQNEESRETQLEYLRSIYNIGTKSRKRSREETQVWREESFKKNSKSSYEKN